MKNKKIIGLGSFILLLFIFQAFNQYPIFKSLGSLLITLSFIFTFLYIVFDIIENIYKKDIHTFKLIIIIFIIATLTLSSVLSLINCRLQGEKILLHDGALQTEIAIDKLMSGQNPYGQGYEGTEMENHMKYIGTLEGPIKNPAIHHYIYLPSYIILSAPFKIIGDSIFNFYDQRIFIYILYLLFLLLVYKIISGKKRKILGLIFLGLNPWILNFILQGRNDIIIIFLLLLIVYLTKKEKYSLAFISLAIAITTKHTAWLFVPFYMIYLMYKKNDLKSFIKFILKKTWPAVIVIIIIITPFLIWDSAGFWRDIYLYPSGSLPTSFPIAGFGFSTLLYSLGFVTSIKQNYPFIVWQFITCMPLFFLLLKTQKKNNTIEYTLFSYTLFLGIFWFFSRFFHDNYIAFLYQLLVIVYFI